MELEKNSAVEYAENHVRTQPIYEGMFPRRVCEAALDDDFMRAFYIGDFLKTHLSGRQFRGAEVEGEHMLKAFPIWQERRSNFLESQGDIKGVRVIRSLSIAGIAVIAGKTRDIYDGVLRLSSERDQEYEARRDHWANLSSASTHALTLLREQQRILNK